jgi:monolysocardiolipin acyltransferase
MAVQRLERGDLWKSKAIALKIQLRDRFRVAVDNSRRRRSNLPAMFSGDDGYLSIIVDRWLRRFRDFRKESLPSSSTFYRKRVSKDFNAEEESAILRMLQAVAVPVLGNVCHVFMNGLNRVQVYGLEKLHDAVLHRPKDKPLVTVSNHVASMDDPLIIASLLPPRVLMDAQNLRWTLCASDRCFRNPVFSSFFRSVKVLPLARGDGIYQKGMDMAIAKLNRGGWVHIFPEGSRSRDGGKTMASSKRGVGRLILDADNTPMVLPFAHSGMQEIMPVGASIPRIGKTVTVVIGDPIRFDDLLNLEEAQHESRGKLYDAAASRIGHRLHELKAEVDELELKQAMQLQNHPVRSAERTAEILQQVDWDSFGMGSIFSSEDDSSLRQESHNQPTQVATSCQGPTCSLRQEIQPKLNVAHAQESASSDRYFKVGFSGGDGLVSRMRAYMDPAELMGFAASGVFVNRRSNYFPANYREVGPLKAWKQFLEANVFQQWNCC